MAILEEGLKAADPKKSIKDALNKLEGEIYKANRVFVIGFGKASLAMAEGCEEKIGDLICNGTIIVPERGEEKCLKVIKVLEGTHPILSEVNVNSTRRLISFCSNLTNDDLVLCLISGGGSSLLALPAEGISLGGKRITTGILLKSGASIKEINVFRKHISRIKGGQLVNFLKPARVISLILSDIVGGSSRIHSLRPNLAGPFNLRG